MNSEHKSCFLNSIYEGKFILADMHTKDVSCTLLLSTYFQYTQEKEFNHTFFLKIRSDKKWVSNLNEKKKIYKKCQM